MHSPRLKYATIYIALVGNVRTYCMSVIILLVGSLCRGDHDAHCLARLSAYMEKVGDLCINTLPMPSDIHICAEISRAKERRWMDQGNPNVLNTPLLRAACCDGVSQVETGKIQQQRTNQTSWRVKQPAFAAIVPFLPHYIWIVGYESTARCALE